MLKLTDKLNINIFYIVIILYTMAILYILKFIVAIYLFFFLLSTFGYFEKLSLLVKNNLS